MTTGAATRLYLSRLVLNPHSRQMMGEMAHPYEMHRTLMRAFPKKTDDLESGARNEFGVLFRAEVDEPRGVVKVFVQSQIEPDWRFLEGLDDYLKSDAEVPGYEHKDIIPALSKIQNGQVFSFRLRANPTKRIAKADDPMKGKRVELIREDEQIAWLIRKGKEREKGVPGGFELVMSKFVESNGDVRLVPRVNVRREGKQKGRKKESGFGHEMTHLSVLFDGLMRVADKDFFLETLIHGIGAGKALGFGLLSVAPVSALGMERTM